MASGDERLKYRHAPRTLADGLRIAYAPCSSNRAAFNRHTSIPDTLPMNQIAVHEPAASETGDPFLLTPGPLTTSRTVKESMVHDWGSRDASFVAINKAVLARLAEIVHGEGDYVTVPMQGSGTFAVEAMLTSFVPPAGQ